MFYEEYEKKIYTPTGTELRLDPLAIDAKLRIEMACYECESENDIPTILAGEF